MNKFFSENLKTWVECFIFHFIWALIPETCTWPSFLKAKTLEQVFLPLIFFNWGGICLFFSQNSRTNTLMNHLSQRANSCCSYYKSHQVVWLKYFGINQSKNDRLYQTHESIKFLGNKKQRGHCSYISPTLHWILLNLLTFIDNCSTFRQYFSKFSLIILKFKEVQLFWAWITDVYDFFELSPLTWEMRCVIFCERRPTFMYYLDEIFIRY